MSTIDVTQYVPARHLAADTAARVLVVPALAAGALLATHDLGSAVVGTLVGASFGFAAGGLIGGVAPRRIRPLPRVAAAEAGKRGRSRRQQHRLLALVSGIIMAALNYGFVRLGGFSPAFAPAVLLAAVGYDVASVARIRRWERTTGGRLLTSPTDTDDSGTELFAPPERLGTDVFVPRLGSRRRPGSP